MDKGEAGATESDDVEECPVHDLREKLFEFGMAINVLAKIPEPELHEMVTKFGELFKGDKPEGQVLLALGIVMAYLKSHDCRFHPQPGQMPH